MKLDDLEPGSPEWEAAVDAAQAEEDAAREGTPPAEEADGEGNTPDSTTTDEATPTEQTTAPEKQNAPAGVFSKDGKKVLPFAVVQAARHEKAAERQARLAAEARADALEQQLEALKSGKPLPSEDDDPLDAAVAAAAEDVPIVAELHKALKETRKQLQAMQGGKTAQEQEQEPQGNPLQDAIDSVPALAEWQATDAEKFQRAQAIDQALKDSPKWRGKPLAERFAHVARQVADEYDLQIDEDEPQPTPNPNKADPRAVVARATRSNPNTLSDFKNGAPDTTPNRIDKLPPARALQRMSTMSDEEIDAHLAKFG